MFKIRWKKGAEQYGDHHQIIVELMPIALGVVIVLILALLLFLLLSGRFQ